MAGLSLCRIRIKCDHCEYLLKVSMQQIADEAIVICKCGKSVQLIDLGKEVRQMLEEEISEQIG